jgi:hypothetical protein
MSECIWKKLIKTVKLLFIIRDTYICEFRKFVEAKNVQKKVYKLN